jgi:cytochrome c553
MDPVSSARRETDSSQPMSLRRNACVAIVVMSAVLIAWPATSEEVKARAISSDARKEALSIFTERCAVCHGTDGDGEGPAASNLSPHPANLRSRKWQSSISDARIAKIIVNGGASEGLSASMASNPDLEDKPDVVAALVEQIRKFGK